MGTKGDKKRGYIWAYASAEHEPIDAVVYQIKEGRSGQHARDFLQQAPLAQSWSGHLVVDDYAGYKALFLPDATGKCTIIEVGC